jgi:superfamily II DNA/RNA helicase
LLDFCFFQVLKAGFSSPTPIQAQSWPVALQSRDIVAVAKTGSGKTLGYLIPGFIHLKRCRNDPQLGPTVLVLSPTRELATQIQDEAVKFGKSSRISCTVCYSWSHMHVLCRSVHVFVYFQVQFFLKKIYLLIYTEFRAYAFL